MEGTISSTFLTLYPWIKAAHIVAVISWMAGLLYLPRLFVYHCEAELNSPQSETFKVMEYKLATFIMRPAMVMSLVLGVVMLAIPGTPGYLPHAGIWLWLKLIFVGGLLAMHFAMMSWKSAFARDENTRAQKFFRIANEVPTVLMIGIVIFVVVKPF